MASSTTEPLLKMIERLQTLKGVGPKTAENLATHLMSRPKSDVAALFDELKSFRDAMDFCSNCFRWSSEPTCSTCKSPSRDRRIICVTGTNIEVLAIEKSKAFKGTYHVLGGYFSPSNSMGVEHIHNSIVRLAQRIKKDDVQEIIFALGFSLEENCTVNWLTDTFKEFTKPPMNVKMSRLATGIPANGEVSMADSESLMMALQQRVDAIAAQAIAQAS